MRNRQLGTSRWIFNACALVVIIIMVIGACRKKEEVQYDYLYGKWDIVRAEKNGKETGYLRNGYFIINADGNMTINITGEDEHGSYQVENNRIFMEGDKIFDIKSLHPDSLTVKYTISSGTDFLFLMKKNKDDAQ